MSREGWMSREEKEAFVREKRGETMVSRPAGVLL
jgi:hypothetical protein